MSGGRIGSAFSGVEFCLLTTKGRRSGKMRTTPLVLIRSKGHLAIVASNNGSDRDPLWYTNLRGEPNVTVETRRERFNAHARVCTAHERESMWPDIVATYAGYDRYQGRTHRVIPVVVLEPNKSGDI